MKKILDIDVLRTIFHNNHQITAVQAENLSRVPTQANDAMQQEQINA